MTLQHRVTTLRNSLTGSRTAPLELSIESLELRGLGLDPAGAERLRAAMSAELEELLRRRGTDVLLAGRFELGALAVRLRAGDSPEAMGRALARGLLGHGSGEVPR